MTMGYRIDTEWAEAHDYAPCPCGSGEWTDTGVCGACEHEYADEDPETVVKQGECVVCGEHKECTVDDGDLVCHDCLRGYL